MIKKAKKMMEQLSCIIIGGFPMDNNDILIRLRYALDIKNNDMIKIFKEGGIELSKEDVLKVLTKTPESEGDDMDSVLDASENADHIRVDKIGRASCRERE